MKQEERDALVEELKEQYPIHNQVCFNEFNIGDKLQENMKLRVKYQELYEHELFKYDKLKEKFDILQGQRYDFYKFESDRNLTKTEIEQYYLPKDVKLRKLKEIIEKQELRMKFFKLCMDSIDKLY
jgi:hypothetical protein